MYYCWKIVGNNGLFSYSLGKQTFLEVLSEGHSVVSNSLWPYGIYSPWNSPGQNTGVGGLSLLQGIFPTQESNPGLPHCRWILYQLSHKWLLKVPKSFTKSKGCNMQWKDSICLHVITCQVFYLMGNRWGNSGNSVRLHFLGLQNNCWWWLKSWN